MSMTRDEAIAKGYKHYCLKCHKVYKEVPKQTYEDGHGGRLIDMCRCGSDLFGLLEEFTDA